MPIFLVTPYYYYHANSLSQHSPVSDVILESLMWQKKLEQLCVDSISQVLLFLPLISNLAPAMWEESVRSSDFVMISRVGHLAYNQDSNNSWKTKVGTVQFRTKQQQLQDKAWSVSQKQEQETKWKQCFPRNNFNSFKCTKWKQSSEHPPKQG